MEVPRALPVGLHEQRGAVSIVRFFKELVARPLLLNELMIKSKKGFVKQILAF
jgi:hypothetical protein